MAAKYPCLVTSTIALIARSKPSGVPSSPISLVIGTKLRGLVAHQVLTNTKIGFCGLVTTLKSVAWGTPYYQAHAELNKQ